MPDTGERQRVAQVEYELREELPTAEQLARLRELNDMAPRSIDGLRRGLPNSVYGVVVVAVGDDGGASDADARGMSDTEAAGTGDIDAAGAGDEPVVGTARIVGDGGSVYHVCDMVVHPDHQRRGVGTLMMDALMDFVDETAPPDAYVNLMADVDGFYERWGFSRTAPVSRGMYLRTE